MTALFAPIGVVPRMSVPMSATSEASRGDASDAIDMRVAAGIEDESGPDEAGNRTITLKNWGDFDVLVGMDLLSRLKEAIFVAG